MTKVIVCSDHAGYELKAHLLALYPRAIDQGVYTKEPADYPLIVQEVACKIKEGYLGIFICGTGIGMSIAANRFSFIRAALCTSPYEAKMARQHNDANVLCLGQRVIGFGVAAMCCEIFLNTSFELRHELRVRQLSTMP